MNRFAFRKELVLPKELREELRKVRGKLAHERNIADIIAGAGSIYAVGDVTVETLLKAGITPRISIFDYRVGRKSHRSRSIARAFPDPVRVRNRSGTISLELWRAVKKAVGRKRSIGILVHGEEDLAAVACAYLGRHGSLLLYGLPGRGIVIVRIDPAIKRHVKSILEQMKRIG